MKTTWQTRIFGKSWLCASLVGLSLVLGNAWTSNTAVAQSAAAEASSADKAAALKAYKKGKKLHAKGDYAGALVAFEQAYKAVPSPNSRLMIAQCQVELGMKLEAHESFRLTVEEARTLDAQKYGPAADAATQAMVALEGDLGQVTVEVSGQQGEASMTVAGKPVSADRWGTPIFVAPGPVQVSLQLADGRTLTEQVDAPAGVAKRVPLDAAPPAEPTVEVGLGVQGPADVDGEDGSEDDSDNPLESRADLGLSFGGKVGGGLGVSAFGGSYVFELELAYLLPLPEPVGHSLGIFFGAGYMQPQTDGTESEADPRLPGDGVLRYEVTEQELTLTLGAIYRIPVGTKLLMPYGAVGARMYLLNTKVEGSGGGEDFGLTEETAMEIGVYVAGGIDIFLGPGALLAELQFGWASLDGFVMRNTSVGVVNLALGYRFII